MQYTKILKVKSPNYGTKDSKGMDFYVPEFDADFMAEFMKMNGEMMMGDMPNVNQAGKFQIAPRKDVTIPLGIKVKFPNDYAMIAQNKSGVSLKKKLRYGMGVVDPCYEGQIYLQMFNDSDKYVTIEQNEKIIQFLFIPCKELQPVELSNDEMKKVYETSGSERKEGGFGSTNDVNPINEKQPLQYYRVESFIPRGEIK